MSTPAETPRPLADRLHDHEPITAPESRALALLLWQVQHANRTAGVKGFDDATHFALWTGIRDVYIHETALAPTAPSSEDTPAPHVHTDTCMCEMYDLEVIGARECTHCGGHTGGPCGSRCPVAYDEIVTPARVWQEGDDEPEGVDLVHDIDALDQNELVYARRMPDGLWRWAFTLDEPLGKRGDMPWQKLFAVATGRLAEVLAEVPAGGEPA